MGAYGLANAVFLIHCEAFTLLRPVAATSGHPLIAAGQLFRVAWLGSA